jgi:hypothetical protein
MVIVSRPLVVKSLGPELVEVSITGSGNSYYGFVDIHGTTHTSAAGGIEVLTGDIITFTVAGAGSGIAEGKVVIDGTQVVSSKNGEQASYRWEVPAGVTKVDIAMTYHNIGAVAITVTTS